MKVGKRVLIRGGTVVTAADMGRADILIEGGRVAAVGSDLTRQAGGAEVIDAAGMYVMPGGIDPHTHLNMPLGDILTADDWQTGTTAAAAGGTTCVVDFSTQIRGGTLREAVADWKGRAAGKAVIDYGLHVAVCDLNDSVLEEMGSIAREEGVTSFKLFMAYKNALQVDDGVIYKTLQRAREVGALVMCHCENGDVIAALQQQALAAGCTDPIYHALTRPPELEGEATGRFVRLGALTGCAVYVVHVSAAQALAEVQAARDRGQAVYAETCPQYLVLDVEELKRPGFEGAKYVWSPPLRERWHQDILWAGLGNGSFQTLGSDQCSFHYRGQKERGLGDFTRIPNGGPAIEDRLSILYHFGVAAGRISLCRFVELTSTSAAKLFGLYPRKGCLAPGADADIVIWDPSAERTLSAATHHMAVDYNPFEGFKVRGAPVRTLVRGETVMADGKFVGTVGSGRFLKREPFNHGKLPL